jgi:EpsI family protein
MGPKRVHRERDIVTTSAKISNRTFFISIAVLVLTLILTAIISMRGKPVVSKTNLENLPMEIIGMQGADDSFSEAVYKELNADFHLYRHYSSPTGRQVDLYIGYYGSAKGGRTPHNPIGCLPSQGWGLLESKEITLKPAYQPEGVPVNCIISSKDDTIMTTIHWYQTAGTKVISNGIGHNIQRFIGMLLHNRNDGAFVRVTVVADKDAEVAARMLAETFSLRILNLLPEYWPIEE